MSNYPKDLYLQGAVLKKDKSLADFSAYTKIKAATPSVAAPYNPAADNLKDNVVTVDYVSKALNGANFTTNAAADLTAFAKIKAATPVVTAPYNPTADDLKDNVVTVDYVSKALNGANFTTSAADLTTFTSVKAATPVTVSLLNTPSSTVKNQVVNVDYVSNVIQDALATTVDGAKVSRITQLESRVNTFMDAISTDDNKVNTLTEVLNLVNSLSGTQGTNLITTFNAVSARITNFENFLGQNQESITQATLTDWPAVSKLTTDAPFQLNRPTGLGFPDLQNDTYALVGESSIVASVSTSGLVTLVNQAAAGTFTVSATNSVRTVTTLVTITAPPVAPVVTWTLQPANYNSSSFYLTPPSPLIGGSGSNSQFPSVYKFVVQGGTVDGNKTVKTGVFSLQNNGSVDFYGGTGSATIQIIRVSDSFLYASAMFFVRDPWTSITPKLVGGANFTLTPPPSMDVSLNGAITYSLGPLTFGDTNEVISLTGNTVQILSAGSRMIMATQSPSGGSQIRVTALQVVTAS